MATESSDPSASGQATTSPFAIRLVFVAGSVFAAMYATVFALAKSSNAAKNVLHKVNMWIHGIVHLIFTNETRWKPEKLDDPANLHEAPEMIKKTVIFIRHGESKWNEIFNDGKAITRFFKPTFFIRLFSGMFWETMDAVSGDSVFLDSPLSMEGVEQAVGLADFLERKEKCEDEKVEEFRQILSGNISDSIICSSNLRRCLATTTIGLWPRLSKGKGKIHVLSCMQESSRNVDTQALSQPGSIAPLPITKATLKTSGAEFDPSAIFIATENHGNKPICEKGKVRLFQFAEWIFSSNSSKVVIAGGHSLYFRNFFRSFLPHKSEHPAKKAKIKNGGAVAFTFCRGKLGDQTLYLVEEKSLTPIYLGFDI